MHINQKVFAYICEGLCINIKLKNNISKELSYLTDIRNRDLFVKRFHIRVQTSATISLLFYLLYWFENEAFKFLIFWIAGCLLAGLSSISEELQCQLGSGVSFQKRQAGKPKISASGKKPLIE